MFPPNVRNLSLQGTNYIMYTQQNWYPGTGVKRHKFNINHLELVWLQISVNKICCYITSK